MVNTILKGADLFCPNSVRINFTIYLNSIFSNVGVATGSAIGGYVVATVGLSGLGIAGSVFNVFTIGVLTILIKYNYN